MSLSDAEAERHATIMMKGMLGVDWDATSAQRLAEVRERMDQKMNFASAPDDLRKMQDQVCTLIVSKIS
jgi:hypothetical protein